MGSVCSILIDFGGFSLIPSRAVGSGVAQNDSFPFHQGGHVWADSGLLAPHPTEFARLKALKRSADQAFLDSAPTSPASRKSKKSAAASSGSDAALLARVLNLETKLVCLDSGPFWSILADSC
jgi:hypothetical protein